MKKTRRKTRFVRGVSLAEILIVVVIIALLAVAAIFGIQRQIDRGYDARRKGDLAKIRSALENYYNDHTAFPTNATWNAMNCSTKTGMDFLTKYLDDKPIPCDPQSNTPYLYEADTCQGFALLAALKDTGDPDIAKLGCSPKNGCGYGLGYDYGVGTGGCSIAAIGFDPGVSPTPTTIPGVTPGDFGCSSDGSGTEGCQNIGRPALEAAHCPSFSTYYCDHMCVANPGFRYGLCTK